MAAAAAAQMHLLHIKALEDRVEVVMATGIMRSPERTERAEEAEAMPETLYGLALREPRAPAAPESLS